ncbi:hypothetical protein ABTY61_35370 [Kitasatospora sp. NPDC096128]|uniref:hypothetical protein n=1 Tax=Kitasatospora sp. NPDC096128 TaxID=3155547 RepID=UPI00332A21BE
MHMGCSGTPRRAYTAAARRPPAGHGPHRSARPERPRARTEEEPIMVKHYLKYAFSTLTAAMFLHMA